MVYKLPCCAGLHRTVLGLVERQRQSLAGAFTQKCDVAGNEVAEMPQSGRAGRGFLRKSNLGSLFEFRRQGWIRWLRPELPVLFGLKPVVADDGVFPQRLVVGEHRDVAPPVALVLFTELGKRSQSGVVVRDQLVDQSRLALGLGEEQVGQRAGGWLVADQPVPVLPGDHVVAEILEEVAVIGTGVPAVGALRAVGVEQGLVQGLGIAGHADGTVVEQVVEAETAGRFAVGAWCPIELHEGAFGEVDEQIFGIEGVEVAGVGPECGGGGFGHGAGGVEDRQFREAALLVRFEHLDTGLHGAPDAAVLLVDGFAVGDLVQVGAAQAFEDVGEVTVAFPGHAAA